MVLAAGLVIWCCCVVAFPLSVSLFKSRNEERRGLELSWDFEDKSDESAPMKTQQLQGTALGLWPHMKTYGTDMSNRNAMLAQS